MDRPSISVTSPMSPGMLRDAPQFLSGQISVCGLFYVTSLVFSIVFQKTFFLYICIHLIRQIVVGTMWSPAAANHN